MLSDLVDDFVIVRMRKRIGLDPDNIGPSDQLGIGLHGSVYKTYVGQFLFNLSGPGIMAAENNDSLCCVIGEGNFADLCILVINFFLLMEDQFSQVRQFLSLAGNSLLHFRHLTLCFPGLPVDVMGGLLKLFVLLTELFDDLFQFLF